MIVRVCERQAPAGKTRWPTDLIAAIKAELIGNARRDLLGWAHRTVDARPGSASADDVKRAMLILEVNATIDTERQRRSRADRPRKRGSK